MSIIQEYFAKFSIIFYLNLILFGSLYPWKNSGDIYNLYIMNF
jgi:hypothetical protein